jgi:ferritin-like metal-binding protein YciE
MDDLLLHGLKDIYYAENQSQRGEGSRQKIVDALRKGVNRRAAR